ncbi:Hsp20/alpha crystallin family protein [Cerasibacillus terrae]|uniref:Hsp20/alpha crystallin family protein n=1 Tax=Cerasibacillus terrae TaxID=2498845 RepID=A0A5C8NZH3_9BACI|nr:Hsp20/alpha crystallin family protein [Cerasibacillus terrae]TXL66472.1 Hsp20/alpha crystallin family protein [Cerasibacillus terrae]
MFDLKPFKKRNDDLDLFERMRTSFNEFFDREGIAPLNGNLNSFRTDVRETKKAYYVEAELPGFDKEDITIDFDNNYLTIHAKRDEKEETKDESDKIIRQERHYGEFIRRFYVDNVEEENVKAKLKRGILKIEIPKREPTKPKTKRIEID